MYYHVVFSHSFDLLIIVGPCQRFKTIRKKFSTSRIKFFSVIFGQLGTKRVYGDDESPSVSLKLKLKSYITFCKCRFFFCCHLPEGFRTWLPQFHPRLSCKIGKTPLSMICTKCSLWFQCSFRPDLARWYIPQRMGLKIWWRLICFRILNWNFNLRLPCFRSKWSNLEQKFNWNR